MKRFITLAIFPLIGLTLLLTSMIWSGRDLTLRFTGNAAQGTIAGMALQRDGMSDLLVGLDTRITLTLADGSRIHAAYQNYEFLSAHRQTTDGTPDRPLSKADLNTLGTNTASPLSPEQRRVIGDSIRGNAEIIRWALLRESRRSNDPRRVLRIEKSENVRGHLDLEKLPMLYGIQDGQLVLSNDGLAMPATNALSIRGVFDFSDAKAVAANKGETLIEYSYLRNGLAITPAKRDFYLASEPYTTQFLPIFSFTANGKPLARISHIGRHGGPTLALQLYGKCSVYYDRSNPAEAILMATPGPVNGDPLGWFSRLCEGIFAQWGSGSLIAIAGLAFLFAGLVFISLAVYPPQPKMAASTL